MAHFSRFKQFATQIDDQGLVCEFNLVAYNPATPQQGVESSKEIQLERLAHIQRRFAGKVKAITRVGLDVKASVGMFAGVQPDPSPAA